MKITNIVVIVVIMIVVSSCSQFDLEESTPIMNTETPKHPLIVETQKGTVLPIPSPRATTPIPTFTLTLENTIVSTATINWEEKMVPDFYKEYLGWEYPPFPDNFQSGVGWVIGREWSVSLLHGEADIILMLGKLSYYDHERKAHWIVSDIFLLPPLIDENERFIPNQCLYNGIPDDEIFVFATLDTENYDRFAENASIRLAWRANREKEAFESIPTDGIECIADNAMDIIR